MAALLKKQSLFQRLKTQVLISEVSFVKTERGLSFGIGRFLFVGHKLIYLILRKLLTYEPFNPRWYKR